MTIEGLNRNVLRGSQILPQRQEVISSSRELAATNINNQDRVALSQHYSDRPTLWSRFRNGVSDFFGAIGQALSRATAEDVVLGLLKIVLLPFSIMGCSKSESTNMIVMPTGSTIGSNIFKWGDAVVSDVSPDNPNRARVYFAPDSGIGINLAGLLSRAGSLPSELRVSGSTLGSITNKFTVGIMDARAYEISSLAAQEERDMTTAEENEFNQHVKYVTYDGFNGSAANDLLINLNAGSFKSFKNIFDHTQNANPYLSFTNLNLDISGTFRTVVNGSGDGLLGALNEDGWNIGSVSGDITVDSLGAGRVYYVVEDINGNQEEVEITGFTNGVHTFNRAAFSPSSNIVRNGQVVSSTVSGNGISFVMNDGGYTGISLANNNLVSIYNNDPVNFTLSGLTAGQLADATVLIQDADGNSISYQGPVGGANSLLVSNFLENARVVGAGSTVTRGANAYTTDILLNRLAGSAVSAYANETVAPNNNSKFKFVLTIPDTGDLSLLNSLDFRIYNYANKSRNLSFIRRLSDYVINQQVNGSNRVVTIEIPNSALVGENIATFGELSHMRLINKGTTSDINLSLSNYQIDVNGTGYGNYYPLMIDRTRIKTVAIYNGSGAQVTGTMTNVSINGTSFIASIGPAADWTSITKIMLRTSGATGNSNIRFRLLNPTFTPVEYGTAWSGDSRVVTLSSAEQTDYFNMNLQFLSAYTIFP